MRSEYAPITVSGYGGAVCGLCFGRGWQYEWRFVDEPAPAISVTASPPRIVPCGCVVFGGREADG
jgi:hypothetical protein